ncbi:MAG: lysophospholipid acyltransferase family protein [Endomicrobiales bacterium]|nr:lysophospholipid acyltransferase family protein [Endomicrobiales bacterium]
MFRKLLRKIYYLLALVFSKIVLILPYSFSVKLGGWLGFLTYYLVGHARKTVEDNLSKCFPDKDKSELQKTARDVFVNQGKNLFEVFSFPKLTEEKIRSIVEIENKEIMEKALSNGKGVLIAGAHCGNWEFMGASLSVSGFPINVIARKIYIEEINRMLVGYRSSKGINVILRSEISSAKEILRSLRNNEAIGVLIDQDTDVPGVFVNFFSRPAWTPSGLVTLAIRTGASVVLALDIRLPDDKHKSIISGPVELVRTGNEENDIVTNTQNITGLIEDHIRKYTSQWVWMHNRWKTRPDSKRKS